MEERTNIRGGWKLWQFLCLLFKSCSSSSHIIGRPSFGDKQFWVICQKVKVKNFHFNRLPKHLPPNLDLNLDQIFASVSPFQLEKNDIVGSQETTSNWGQHSVFCQYSLANVHIVILQGYLSLLWMEWVYQNTIDKVGMFQDICRDQYLLILLLIGICSWFMINIKIFISRFTRELTFEFLSCFWSKSEILKVKNKWNGVGGESDRYLSWSFLCFLRRQQTWPKSFNLTWNQMENQKYY